MSETFTKKLDVKIVIDRVICDGCGKELDSQMTVNELHDSLELYVEVCQPCIEVRGKHAHSDTIEAVREHFKKEIKNLNEELRASQTSGEHHD